jgi:very-short-patch-repair endonuclease
LPNKVCKGSNLKFLFDCDKCNHEFEKQLNSINKDSWCPYCVNQKICINQECKFCYNNSVVSHPKSKYWSDKNKLKPREVFLNCNTKFIFDCDICNHQFERLLSDIQYDSTHCSYCCVSSRLLCNDNNCAHCFEKSFASHEKSKYWSNKNKLKSREVFKGNSTNKFIFNCEQGHGFEMQCSNITSNNQWCSICKNKTEQKLFDNLKIIYPSLIHQYKVEWCKNKTFLPFDFVLEEYNIIIELDGKQHFIQVKNWNSPEETHETDKYKMKCANDNKFSVIRILQEDVYYDTFNWLDELKDNIEKIKNENIIQNIFICKNNEYDIFNTK